MDMDGGLVPFKINWSTKNVNRMQPISHNLRFFHTLRTKVQVKGGKELFIHVKQSSQRNNFIDGHISLERGM